jgi:hypothetical protein
MVYLTDPDPRGSMGWRKTGVPACSLGNYLTAIDPKTGVASRHEYTGGGGGLLAAAGGLVSPETAAGISVAHDASRETAMAHADRESIQRHRHTCLTGSSMFRAVGDTIYDFDV